jgi:hypothetical protein
VTRCRRRRGSSVVNAAAGFVIPKMADFAHKVDLAAELRGTRVDAITIGIDLAFLMLLRHKRCPVTRQPLPDDIIEVVSKSRVKPCRQRLPYCAVVIS